MEAKSHLIENQIICYNMQVENEKLLLVHSDLYCLSDQQTKGSFNTSDGSLSGSFTSALAVEMTIINNN